MTTNNPKVKKISLSYLKNIALWYVDQYGGTRYRVQRVLERRVHKAQEIHGKEPEAQTWVQTVLDHLEAQGHINDEVFAVHRLQKDQRQGKSLRLIKRGLIQAGVPEDVIKQVVKTSLPFDKNGDNNADLAAARFYVQRHSLGCFRDNPDTHKKRDLGKLARRGFSYEIAHRALRGE